MLARRVPRHRQDGVDVQRAVRFPVDERNAVPARPLGEAAGIRDAADRRGRSARRSLRTPAGSQRPPRALTAAIMDRGGRAFGLPSASAPAAAFAPFACGRRVPLQRASRSARIGAALGVVTHVSEKAVRQPRRGASSWIRCPGGAGRRSCLPMRNPASAGPRPVRRRGPEHEHGARVHCALSE